MPADEEMVEDDEEEERGKGASIATPAQRPAGAKVKPPTTPSSQHPVISTTSISTHDILFILFIFLMLVMLLMIP